MRGTHADLRGPERAGEPRGASVDRARRRPRDARGAVRPAVLRPDRRPARDLESGRRLRAARSLVSEGPPRRHPARLRGRAPGQHPRRRGEVARAPGSYPVVGRGGHRRPRRRPAGGRPPRGRRLRHLHLGFDGQAQRRRPRASRPGERAGDPPARAGRGCELRRSPVRVDLLRRLGLGDRDGAGQRRAPGARPRGHPARR
jgi:hypothetical protein